MTHGYFQTVAGANDTCAGDATQLEWELDEDRVRCVVLVQLISSGAQLGSIGDLVAFGVLLLFSFHSRTLIVFGCCNALFMYCVKWQL